MQTKNGYPEVFEVVESKYGIRISKFKVGDRNLEKLFDCYKREYLYVFEVGESKYDIGISKFRIADQYT